MASRILGMGDMLTLIEKAQETFDQKQAAEAAKKIISWQTYTDGFLSAVTANEEYGLYEGYFRYASWSRCKRTCRCKD